MRLPEQQSKVSGTEFIDLTQNKSVQERDAMAGNLILRGNFPSFLRTFVPITITQGDNTLVYRVSPDFLRIGNDTNSVIWPLSAEQAQKIADAFGCILPTPKMSKQIWEQAKVRLSAKPLSGMTSTIGNKTYSPSEFTQSKHMVSNEGIALHNKIIQRQLNDLNYRPGDLVAGGKKDIVLSNELTGTGRMGLHGLYDSEGNAIQKGSLTPHPTNHIEYAIGTRLIDRNATLNNEKVDLLNDVLKSKTYANLINEGPLSFTSYKQSDENLKPISNYPNEQTGAPQGFRAFQKGEEVPLGVKQMAKKILDLYIREPFGTVVPFTSDGKKYMARIERHSNAPRGITVYKAKSDTTQTQSIQVAKQTPPKDDSQLLGPIYHYFDEAAKALRGLI